MAKWTAERKKAARERMKALNAKREQAKGPQNPAESEIVRKNSTISVGTGDSAPEPVKTQAWPLWLSVYFEDGRSFRVPVVHIIALLVEKGHKVNHVSEIMELAQLLEWHEVKSKAIPFLRPDIVNEAEAWKTARKEVK